MPFRTATLKHLLDLVQDLIDEHGEQFPVAFSSDYGDHSHTEQLLPIELEATVKMAVESGYSDSGYAAHEPEAGEDEDERGVEVVVIS